MYNYLIENPLISIIFLVLVVAVLIFLFVKAMQKIGIEKVRAIVYNAFIKAEYMFEHGDNTEKFDYVVQLARSSIPKPFNLFITENTLRRVIQLWFDLCKDFFDDGKLNGTGDDTNREV